MRLRVAVTISLLLIFMLLFYGFESQIASLILLNGVVMLSVFQQLQQKTAA